MAFNRTVFQRVPSASAGLAVNPIARHPMNRAGIPFGVFAILVGLGVGCLMVAFPEGVSPAYPIWIALLAPLAFVFGGLLILAQALDNPGFSALAVKALALCLLVIVNWAAFFAGHIQCRETLSFLGAAILERYPSEVECRESLRIVMACLDSVVLVALLAFVWRKWASGHSESTQ